MLSQFAYIRAIVPGDAYLMSELSVHSHVQPDLHDGLQEEVETCLKPASEIEVGRMCVLCSKGTDYSAGSFAGCNGGPAQFQ